MEFEISGNVLNITYTGSGTGAMGDYTYGAPWANPYFGVTAVNVGEGVTRIGNNAFSNMDAVSSVSLPSTLTSIGSEAFYHCQSLTSVSIPQSVTEIGSGCFFPHSTSRRV